MKARFAAMILIASGALLGGCAYPEPYPVYDGRPVAQRTEYGVVESMELYRYGGGGPVGLGTILGGIAGGVIGHQFGSGSGNTAATIAGAIGGAVVGNQVEQANARDRYRVIVRLDSGGTVALNEVGEGQMRVGDRVRIVNRRVYRY
jgi:outer membrane lipoprotein SlyB